MERTVRSLLHQMFRFSEVKRVGRKRGDEQTGQLCLDLWVVK